jgi:hypothetical protein
VLFLHTCVFKVPYKLTQSSYGEQIAQDLQRTVVFKYTWMHTQTKFITYKACSLNSFLCRLLAFMCVGSVSSVLTHFNCVSVNCHLCLNLTPRRKLLFEKLSAIQLFKKFGAFYGTKGSLPCLEESAIGLYSEPDASNPYCHILKSILILFSNLRLVFQVASSFQVFRLKFCV